MRIFVIGTGRCGTVTFSKACDHITNYTNGHETTGRSPITEKLIYPDNHIEVDASLSHFIPLLREKYPGSLFVHLQRDRKSCVNSLMKRESLYSYAGFHLKMHHTECMKNMRLIAEIYYDNTVNMINQLFTYYKACELSGVMHIKLDLITVGFIDLMYRINAEYDKKKAVAELQIKHNKS